MDPINAANIERRVMNLENEVAKLKEACKADDSDSELNSMREWMEQEKAKRLKAESILIRLSDWSKAPLNFKDSVNFQRQREALASLIKEAQNHLRIPQ